MGVVGLQHPREHCFLALTKKVLGGKRVFEGAGLWGTSSLAMLYVVHYSLVGGGGIFRNPIPFPSLESSWILMSRTPASSMCRIA